MNRIFDLKNWDGFIPAWFRGSSAGRREAGIQNGTGGALSGLPANVGPISEDFALKLSAVWACVRIIANAMGAMPINVYEKKADGTRETDDKHPLFEVLNFAPNSWQTRPDFMQTLIFSLLLSGNAYFRIGRTGKRITSLIPLMASQMTVELLPNGSKQFTYTESGEQQTFSAREIWHVPFMGHNGVTGLSALEYAARTMNIAQAADDRVGTMAANGFKRGGVLMVPGMLKAEQRDAIRKQNADLQTGQGDALKILEGNMKFEGIAISPKDAQLLEARRFQIEEIARIFGVPSVLINETSASTAWGTGIGEIKEGFWTLTLAPLAELIEQSIVRWLIGREDWRKVGVEFDMAAFLRGNERTRVDTNAAAIQSGQLTVNEARRREGRPPVEGGDTVFAQAQMRPLEQIANPPEPPALPGAPAQLPPPTEDNDEDRESEEDAQEAA